MRDRLAKDEQQCIISSVRAAQQGRVAILLLPPGRAAARAHLVHVPSCSNHPTRSAAFLQTQEDLAAGFEPVGESPSSSKSAAVMGLLKAVRDFFSPLGVLVSELFCVSLSEK